VPAPRRAAHRRRRDGQPGGDGARVSVFLSAALIDLAQEQPRDGVVITTGTVPAAIVTAARFGLSPQVPKPQG